MDVDYRFLGPKIEHSVSVSDFGAIGNGQHDDTLAIRSALDSVKEGQTLFFPPGLYLISRTLVVRTSFIRILGNQAILRTAKPIQIICIPRQTRGAVVQGLTFCGDGRGSEQRGLQADGAGGSFRVLQFKQLGGSGYKDTGSDNRLEDSSAIDCYFDSSSLGDYGAITLSGSKRSVLRRCLVMNSRRSGLSVSGSQNCLIDSMRIVSSSIPFQLMGIFELDGASGNTYENIIIDNAQHELFDMRGIGGASINRLSLKGDAAYGLSISSSRGFPNPSDISISQFDAKMNSGVPIHVSSRDVSEVVSNVRFTSSLIRRTVSGNASVILRYRTKNIRFDNSTFDGGSIHHEDTSEHDLSLVDCHFKNFRDPKGTLLNITQTRVVNCLFSDITAKALADRSWSSRKNVSFRECKTAGRNKISYLVAGSDVSGVARDNAFCFVNNKFPDIETISDFRQWRPVVSVAR